MASQSCTQRPNTIVPACSQTVQSMSCKRASRAPSATQQTENDHSHKKMKETHDYGGYPKVTPPIFWDRLSTIVFTRRALRELQRRISESTCEPNIHDIGRSEPTDRVGAEDLIRRLSAGDLRQLRLLARRGGPNLEEVRGVRLTIPFPSPPFLSRPRLFVDDVAVESTW